MGSSHSILTFRFIAQLYVSSKSRRLGSFEATAGSRQANVGYVGLPMNVFDLTSYFSTRPCGMARPGSVEPTYITYVRFPVNNFDLTLRFIRREKCACARHCYFRSGIGAGVS